MRPHKAATILGVLLLAPAALADEPAKPADAAPPAAPQQPPASPPTAPAGAVGPASSPPAQHPPSYDDPRASVPDAALRVPHPSDTVRNFDFMDTRITWTFGDDDVTKPSGEALPFSPKSSVGDRPQYRLFYEGLNSRFAGRENLTHLVLYRKMPGFIEGVDTEAALVMRVDMDRLSGRNATFNSTFYDAGSYLRVLYKTGKTPDGLRNTGVDLTFFPLDTDRMRLGYLYAISWGGTAQSINESIFPRLNGTAPGVKAQLTGPNYYAYVGLKTAQISEPQAQTGDGANTEFTRVLETNYGFLGGFGVDFTDNVRLDGGAGYFEQGRFEPQGLLGKRVYTMGGSGRVVVHDGMPVPASVDFQLYRNDPSAPMVMFRPETYRAGATTWAIALEGTRLMQNLADFERPDATKLQPATAGAISGTVKTGYLRVQATGLYRDLAFVVKNQPGFIPFTTMPKGAELSPETSFAVTFDYFLKDLHLTPSLGGGVQVPATFTSVADSSVGGQIGRTVVVRQQGNISILPDGKSRVPIVQGRAAVRWDLSNLLASIVWVQVSQDNNGTRLAKAADGTNQLRTFVQPTFIGYGISMQARF